MTHLTATAPPVEPGLAITDREFEDFRRLILRETGISLNEAKRELVCSRLARRLRHYGLPSYGAYYDHLMQQDPQGEELRRMINCITTNKTDFFREAHHFDFLRDTVFPQLRERARRGGPRKLRIWCAASSTGEEPYSIALSVLEHFGPPAGWDVKILASDIDTDVLAKAREGVYPEDKLEGVPESYRRKYFLKGTGVNEGLTLVRPEPRHLLTFRRINLVEEPWPIHTRFDVIFCRNVVIYFNRQTQQRLFERMAGLLEPDGYLLLGHSENLHWLTDLYTSLGNTVHCLRRGHAPAKPAPRPVTPAPHPGVKEAMLVAGEVYASREPSVVKTVLGSCVAACLFDAAGGVGGMNHFLLPASAGDEGASSRYGVHAMELLINEIMRLGGDRRRLQAKVFGGARVLNFTGPRVTVGEQNARFVKEFLATEGIPIVGERLGGTSGVKVHFHTHTGAAQVKAFDGSTLSEVAAQERRLSTEVTRKLADAGGVTLF